MIDFLPSNYVIGVDCYFRGGSPINPKLWPFFKNLKRMLVSELYRKGFRRDEAIVAVTEDMAQQAFNPVCHMITNVVLRDGRTQFEYFCQNMGIDFRYEPDQFTYFLTLNPATDTSYDNLDNYKT